MEDHLPLDIILYVLSFLSCSELIHLETISKIFRRLVLNERLWKQKCTKWWERTCKTSPKLRTMEIGRLVELCRELDSSKDYKWLAICTEFHNRNGPSY